MDDLPPSYESVINNNQEQPTQGYLQINNVVDSNSPYSQSNNDSRRTTTILYPNIPSNQPNNLRDFEPTISNASEKRVRFVFIRKVYLILMLLFCVTFGMVTFVLFHTPTLYFFWKITFLVYSMALVICMSEILIYSINLEVRRRKPWNYICLGYFSTIISLTFVLVAADHYSFMIWYFLGLMVWMFFFMVLLTYQSIWNISFWGGVAYIAAVIFLTQAIIGFIFISSFSRMFLTSSVAFFFGIFLFYKILAMMSGFYVYPILPEDYVFCVLNLYLDFFLPSPCCRRQKLR